LARKHRVTDNNPPAQAESRTIAKLKRAVRGLRQTARGDPEIVAVCDEAQRLIDSGWIKRKGGGERTRPAKMPPEWKDSPEPPEEPKGTR
jgi:hypothetical protein